jgi:CBS domain containing-hemolysin-like protein
MVPARETWPMALAAVGLLLFSAALSAAEVALFSLGSEQIQLLERQGRPGIYSAQALLKLRDETLVTLLIVDYVANLAVVACLLMIFSHVFPGQPLLWAPLGGLTGLAAILLLGEYLPRAIGRSFPVPIAMAAARPIVGLTALVAPLRWLVLGVSNVLLRLPGESVLEREMGTEEELKTLLTASDAQGELEADERELITGVVEFGATRVGEIMTPQPEIRAFSDETPHEEMLRRMQPCEFSRVLIYTDTLDNIRGVLHVKDLLLNPQTDYREMLRKPLVVPETKSLLDLLREFRRRRIHLAIVCDEFGRTAGIVTMHDLLEEIVGEITEEDEARSPELIRPAGPNRWYVLGRADLHALRETLGLEISEEKGRTISGVVTNELGRIPAVGDTLELNGYKLTVTRMGVRRVAQLRVERLEPPPAEEPKEAQG